MRTVCLRGLNGLIVLWGIIACLVVAGGRDLLAAPGDCDKECRMPSIFGYYDGTKNTCAKYMLDECLQCSGGGGCNSNPPKLDGTCQEDKSMPQEEDITIECTIYCNTITKNIMYEATTKATEFKFEKSNRNRYKCLPKAGGE